MSDEKSSCADPAAGPIVSEEIPETETEQQPRKGTPMVQAKVGKKAPDFEAVAFVDGGFKTIKLSDYAGKWVAVCFYPGDFTFV